MAAQGFIQPLAQGNQMLSPNNGNPNTVYNRAAPAAPVQGWAANPITPAANYKGTDVQATIAAGNAATTQNGWTAPAPDPNAPVRQPILQLPEGWAEKIENFDPNKNPVAPTTPAPTPTPAPIDWNKQWVVVTKGVPGKNTDLYANDPAYKRAYDQAVAEHKGQFNSDYTKKSDVPAIETRLKQLYQQYYGAAPEAPQQPSTGVVSGGGNGPQGQGWVQGTASSGLGLTFGKPVDNATVSGAINHVNSGAEPRPSGWNSGDGAMSDKLNSFVDSTLGKLGNNITSNNVMQVLDAITEPFMPGNLYMSELGKVNMPNVLSSVLNKVVPGLGTLGKWLAGKIPENAGGLLGKIRGFFLNGKFQEAANEIYKDYDMEKAQNEAIHGSTGGGGGGGNRPTMGGGGGSWIGGGWMGGGGSSFKPNVSVGDLQQV